MDKPDLFIFAGETSGDVHGEILLQALQKKAPHLKIIGVGGPRMRKYLSSCFIPMESFRVMGFIDIIKAYPKLVWNFHKIKRHIKKTNPKAVIFIDYPGFTIRLENALRNVKYSGKLIHYISPTVWAWGKWRLAYMIRNLDLLFSIYPFEKDYLEKRGLNAHYIGHPLVRKIQMHQYADVSILDRETKPILAIFPGSRPKEIERNFSKQYKVAREFAKDKYRIAISIAEDSLKHVIIQENLEDVLLIDKNFTYELMRRSTLAIATSGTINLELALHCVPTVVTYGMSALDLFLARRVFKIILPHYCIVNILLGKEVYPELYGPHLTEGKLKESLLKLNHEECIKQCLELQSVLTSKNSAEEASREILNIIQ